MNINCTVIIQIGNFFLAWFLLERVLLKAVLEKLNLKKTLNNNCLDLIEQNKKEIQILEQNQKVLWNNFSIYCKHNSPSLQVPHTIKIERSSCKNELDNQEVGSLSEDYTIRIISWLKDV